MTIEKLRVVRSPDHRSSVTRRQPALGIGRSLYARIKAIAAFSLPNGAATEALASKAAAANASGKVSSLMAFTGHLSRGRG